MAFFRRLAPWVLAMAATTSAACSSSSDDAAAPGGGPDGGDGGSAAPICTPPLRALTKPNTAAYRFFASDAEAVADGKELLIKGGRASTPALPPGSPQQAQAEAIIKQVYPAFRKLYPEQTEGLDTPPRVVIVDAPTTPNAFAARDEGSSPPTAPWYIFFNTGAFAATVTPDDLIGVVGHEMSHLILRNNADAVVAAYARHYKVTDEASVFGASQPDDPAVAARATELETLRAVVGPTGAPELLGVPYAPLASPGAVGTYIDLWGYTYGKYKTMSPSPTSCAKLDTDLAALKASFKSHLVNADYAYTADAAFKADVQAQATIVRDDMAKCLPGFKRTFAALFAERQKDEPTFVPPVLDAVEKAAEAKFAGTNFVGEYLELASTKGKELAAVEAKTDLPLDSLRVYRAEEDADIAAAYVLHQLGKDPRSTALFLLHSGAADYAAQCIAKAKGQAKAPTYGLLRNDHPATCWRYWNLDRLAGLLDASCAK